jgi:hypothetical protein
MPYMQACGWTAYIVLDTNTSLMEREKFYRLIEEER